MPHLFYLIGPPASGKCTIGQALERQTGAVLLDNHLWSDPIFRAFGVTGTHALPSGSGPLREGVRLLVIEAARQAPASVSHVFTNYLTGEARELDTYRSMEALAGARGATFVPVVLTCDEAELHRRIDLPQRRERLKLRDGAILDELLRQRGCFSAPTGVPVLNTAELDPEAAAAQIAALGGLFRP